MTIDRRVNLKPVEDNCYSLMNTLLIKANIHRLNITKDERIFAAYALKEIKELARKGSVSSDVKNYFLKHINPQQAGFASRWLNFYRVAEQSRIMSKQLGGKTDLERLEFAAGQIMEHGFACCFNAASDITFEGDNALKMEDVGCFITTKAILDKAVEGNFPGVFSVFYQVGCMDKLTLIIDTCQASGFGIVLDRHPYRLNQVAPLDLVPHQMML